MRLLDRRDVARLCLLNHPANHVEGIGFWLPLLAADKFTLTPGLGYENIFHR